MQPMKEWAAFLCVTLAAKQTNKQKKKVDVDYNSY